MPPLRAMLATGLLLALCANTLSAADEPPPFSPRVTVFFSPFVHHDGATLFRAVCQGCHMADAKGATGAGTYPALAANPKLASAAYPAITVIKGRHGMPAFADYMTDAQVAEVVNYVRTHFDNHYTDALTADDVKRLR
jgi:mono/diheme cytochrome c family protein